MKNLTIKKVALGLLLAGYAASGAFAAQTATTSATISGTAPVLYKGATAPTTPAATDYGIAVTIKKGAGNSAGSATAMVPEIGDTLTFTFNTGDADGDTEILTKGTTKNFEIYYTKDGTNYTKAATSSSSIGVVTLNITATHIGVTNFAYRVKAETQYGAPDTGLFYAGLLSAAGAPDTSSTEPALPPNGGVNGNIVTPPSGGIASGSLTVAIFNTTAGTYTLADNYSASATSPKLGETFEVKVWNDNGLNSSGTAINGAVTGEIDSGEVVYTYAASGTAEGTFTNVKWGYIGSDSAANGGGTASATYTTQQDIASATNQTFQLPTTNPTGIGYAGYQGFKLSVTVDVH